MPTQATSPQTIRTLLADSIDYAGLFPPAGLDMRPAVARFARHLKAQQAWILRSFVVPAARLDEFAVAARKHIPGPAPGAGPAARRPWTLSVLAGDDFNAASQQIEAFQRRYGDGKRSRVVIASVEIKPADAEQIARATRDFERFQIFHELPYDKDPGPLMAAIKACGGCAKIRTGGVTADLFPAPEEILRFLRAADRTGLRFKATAGLHHPLRGSYRLTYEDAGSEAQMYGFLNVFLAAVAVSAGGIREADVLAMLLEMSPKAFSFSDDAVSWRDHSWSPEQIAETRSRFAVSYGSCSFSEPVAGLRRLKFL